jgi:trehalose 6-phosphate phosphatase
MESSSTIADQAKNALRPPSPHLADHHWAWFLDVDGTLLDIEEHPDLVSADRRLLELLKRMVDVYDGAVALISGRSLEQLDTIFGALGIAAAASHGLELRPANGPITNLAQAVPTVQSRRIAEFVASHPGLVMERKPFSIGVHYRARPELEREVCDQIGRIQGEIEDAFKLQHGKMMVELLPLAANKGSAIRTFMKNPPFSGRRPVFLGDDVTDEPGFAAVNAMDGLSVRIGDSDETAAEWRLANVSETRVWLRSAISLV